MWEALEEYLLSESVTDKLAWRKGCCDLDGPGTTGFFWLLYVGLDPGIF